MNVIAPSVRVSWHKHERTGDCSPVRSFDDAGVDDGLVVHATHAARRHAHGGCGFGLVGNKRLGGEDHAGD